MVGENVVKKPFSLRTPQIVSAYFGSLPAVPKIPAYNPASVLARGTRPIFSLRESILKTILGNRLSLIVSQAGYGKTTQVPQYLLEIAEAVQHTTRIICVVPQRIQAAAMAQNVAAERGEKLGETVGYHSLLETHVSPVETLLTYTTYEALLRALIISSNLLDTTSWIFVDELQEQDPLSELLIFYLARALTNFPALRVVVMSCNTIDRLKLVKHLQNTGETSFGVIAIPDGPSPKIDHMPSLPIPEDTQFMAGVKSMQLAEVEGEMSVNFEVLTCYVSYLHCLKPKCDTMLVFLPEYDSLVTMKQMILHHSSRKLPDGSFVLFLLHSESKTGDYEKIFDKSAQRQGKRTIILTTELAETCLSVQAAIVIDSGKIRRQVPDKNGVQSLLGWISQSSADARAKRAEENGCCYRMYSEACHKAMRKYQPPGTRRLVMGKLVAFASCLVRDVYASLGSFLQPISKEEIDAAYKSMAHLGVLDANRKITKLGFMVMNFPMEPRLTRALIYAVTFRCLDPILTLIAAMCLKEFYLPTDCSLNKKRRRRRKAEAAAGRGSFSDHLEIITTFKEWEVVFGSGSYAPTAGELVTAAIFELVHGIRTNLVSQLRACGYIQPKGAGDLLELNKHGSNWALVKAVLFTALHPQVVFADPVKDKLLWLLPDEVESESEVSIRLHWSTIISTEVYFRKFRKACIMYGELLTGPNASFLKACTVVNNMTVWILSGAGQSDEARPQTETEAKADDAPLDNLQPQENKNSGVPNSANSAQDFLRDALIYVPEKEIKSEAVQELKRKAVEMFGAGSLSEDTFLVLDMMRRGVKRLFRKQVEDPGCDYTKEEEALLVVTGRLLAQEDKALGLTLPKDQKNFGLNHSKLMGGDLLGVPVAGFQNGSQESQLRHEE